MTVKQIVPTVIKKSQPFTISMGFSSNHHQIQNAVDCVQQNSEFLSSVSLKYNIPKSTLFYRLKNHGIRKEPGKRPMFSPTEESLLKDVIDKFDEDSHALFPSQIRDLAHLLLSIRDNCNDYLQPSHNLLKIFLTRHPELKKRQTNLLENYRNIAMSANNIPKFFQLLFRFYKKYNTVCNKQVFNVDETGFSVRDRLKSKQKAVL